MLGINERMAAMESRLRGIESTLQELLRVMRLPEDVRAAEYHARQYDQENLRRAISNQGMAVSSNPYRQLDNYNAQFNSLRQGCAFPVDKP